MINEANKVAQTHTNDRINYYMVPIIFYNKKWIIKHMKQLGTKENKYFSLSTIINKWINIIHKQWWKMNDGCGLQYRTITSTVETRWMHATERRVQKNIWIHFLE